MDCAAPPEVATLAEVRPYLDACEIPEGFTLSVRVVEVTPSVLVVRLTSHPACKPERDEQSRLERFRRRALEQARGQWGPSFSVEYATAECRPVRAVEARVVKRG